MKRQLQKNIILLILMFTLIFPIAVNAQENDIKVNLKNDILEFRVPPKNINGRVMVPLRKIFEEIGLEVGWHPNTKKITGKKEGTLITLQVGNRYAEMNGEGRFIDAPPVIIDGSTLVPVRFITESTGLDVSWNQDTKTVYINDPKKAHIYKETSDKFVSGYNEVGMFNLGSNGKVLNIIGKLEDSRRKLINIRDLNGKNKGQEVIDSTRDGSFQGNIDLKDLEGSYIINQFVEDKNKQNHYTSYYKDIPIKVENDSISFELSPTYEDNYNSMIKRGKLYSDINLNLDYLKAHEKRELTKLAKEITKGKATDYDKILAIHDWIADNIYYNFDGLYSGDYGANDPLSVYKNKKAVCQGYANLFQALGRIESIPTRVVVGYSLGIGTNKTWNKESLSQRANHAWNEAFVDGRWVIIDSTWDSTNKYENKEFIKGDIMHRYFDPSLQYFSLSHRIISNY